jgi:hypothetical protein
MYGKTVLEKSSPKVRSFVSYQKKSFNNETQISERTRKVSVHQPLCYLLILIPHPINFFSNAQKNTADDPNDPEPADLGNIHMKYSS